MQPSTRNHRSKPADKALAWCRSPTDFFHFIVHRVVQLIERHCVPPQRSLYLPFVRSDSRFPPLSLLSQWVRCKIFWIFGFIPKTLTQELLALGLWSSISKAIRFLVVKGPSSAPLSFATLVASCLRLGNASNKRKTSKSLPTYRWSPVSAPLSQKEITRNTAQQPTSDNLPSKWGEMSFGCK